jgi:homoserine/homoserine lactone efflux protein
MSVETYITYLLAVILLVIIPGPTVTLIIGNSLRHGTRAGLLNILGNEVGLGLIIAIVGFGLASVAVTMSWWFDWLRLAGAAYLVWLGWKMLRSAPPAEDAPPAPRPSGGFLLQGLLVSLSNPKTLFFFGAFLPQFMDPHGNAVTQLALLGVTAMVVAALSDSAYALLAGRAGTLIARRRIHLLSKASGLCLIGGGAWLALARRS